MDYIAIIGFFLTVLTFLGISIKRSAKLSWRKTAEAIKKVLPQVRNYDPDLIIGLADGMVAASIISVNLPLKHQKSIGFRPFYALGVSVRYDQNEGKIIQLLGTEVVPKDLAGQKVLLIDNHTYTGATMRDALMFLSSKGALQIKTLALFVHEIEEKVCNPDIYAFKIKGSRKAVPWSLSNTHRSVYNT